MMQLDHRISAGLSKEECHEPVKANVAWLRMVYLHLIQASKPDGKDSLSNAIVYVTDMIYKSIGEGP